MRDLINKTDSPVLTYLSNERKKRLRHLNKQIFSRPPAYQKLFKDYHLKYICLKGGRGGLKSFSVVGFLIEESFRGDLANSLFLFAREIQVSIEDSVYAMCKSFIEQAGLTDHFKILSKSITNTLTGVKFAFTGLRSTGGKTAASQINKIKGKLAIKYVFVDEAQTISLDSIETLFPTVSRNSTIPLVASYKKNLANVKRAIEPDARFIFAMNPHLEIDPIIEKLTSMQTGETKKSTIAILHKNIFDFSPRWQDKQLLNEAKLDRKSITYGHVWLGQGHPGLGGFPFAKIQSYTRSDTEIDTRICFIDPSSDGKDRTAITFLGVDDDGMIIIWGRTYLQSWSNALGYMCDLIDMYSPQINYYEQNFTGLVLRDMFLEKRGVSVQPELTTANKEYKIFSAGAAILPTPDIDTHRARLLEPECNGEYISHLKGYHIDAEFDDAPDSAAMALLKMGVYKMEKTKY